MKHSNDLFLRKIGNPWVHLLLDLQNEFSYATYSFYRSLKIPTIYLPITTGAISSPMGLGSDSSPVEIELFGVKTYLSDSMQFFLEYGCRFIPHGCFYIMPSFRGENSDKRHLCQFYHSEAEIPGDFENIRQLVENYVKYLSQWMLDRCADPLLEIVGSVTHIEKMASISHFPTIEYNEAILVLQNFEGCLSNNQLGISSITPCGEAKLIQLFDGVVWLNNMDERLVPFYQATTKNGCAICGDLLFGIGEVVGAGQRCENDTELISSLERHNVSTEGYDWYIKMKKYYPMKTSGFGMGTERFLMWIMKHDDIRDCQLISRTNGCHEYI